MNKVTRLRYLTYNSCIALILFVPTAESDWQVKRNAHGQPNLQGIWTNTTRTPLQRPEEYSGSQFHTPDEVVQIENRHRQSTIDYRLPVDPSNPAPEQGKEIRDASDKNFAILESSTHLSQINGRYPTSLIVEPSDGKMPIIEGSDQHTYFKQLAARGFGEADGPEIRMGSERCLVIWQLPTMHPMDLISSNYRIVQTNDKVVIQAEALDNTRIIRLNGKHIPNTMQQWLGDSVGYWQDDTLVVHTNRFRAEQSNFFFNSTIELEIEEWFTPISDDEILYRYRVTDPAIYSQPWTVEMILWRRPDSFRLFESACHEGNYSLPNILAGARHQESRQEN